MRPLDFSIDPFFQPHYGPGVDSPSNLWASMACYRDNFAFFTFLLIWILLGQFNNKHVFKKLPDDDPDMDRNMQQTINKTSVNTVILNWFENLLC
jgi:hypothetical protein